MGIIHNLYKEHRKHRRHGCDVREELLQTRQVSLLTFPFENRYIPCTSYRNQTDFNAKLICYTQIFLGQLNSGIKWEEGYESMETAFY